MYEDFNITQYNQKATWKDLLLSQMKKNTDGAIKPLADSYNEETKKWK